MLRLLPLLVVLCPIPAHAGDITSSQAAVLFHILFGNIVIGILETLFVVLVFKLQKKKSILILFIVANYYSMIICSFIFGTYIKDYDIPIFVKNINLHNSPFIILKFVVLHFILYTIIEWPFTLVVFYQKTNWLKLSFMASVSMQIITYVLLIPYYLAFTL